MSNPVSPLDGAQISGIANAREIGLHGMITVRTDFADPSAEQIISDVIGVMMPAQGQITVQDLRGIAWMSSDELMILCPYSDALVTVQRLREGLKNLHALVVNVSDARAVFELAGPRAREVLAKLAPADLMADQFMFGMFRRTRLAQIPAAFWLHGPDTFRIVTFRSTAQYALDALHVAAQTGSEVFDQSGIS